MTKRALQCLAQAWALLLSVTPGVAAENGAPMFEVLLAPATDQNPRNSEADVVVLSNGTLLAGWSEFYGGADDFASARIVGARSTDGGRTWGKRFILQENVGKHNVMSVSFLRSRSGDLLFFYLLKNSRQDLTCLTRRSTDDAESWGEPVVVTPDPGYHVMNNARVIQLRSGRILCPISVTREVCAEGENFRSVVFFSDDDGRTFYRGAQELTCPQRGAMEPGLVELADGRVLQILRTQTGKIWRSYSADGGRTWSEAEPWTVSAPEAPSTVVRLRPLDHLLLIYNPNVVEGAGHLGPRTPLVAALSKNDGRTWSEAAVIEASPDAAYAYTSVTLHEGRALLTYYVAPVNSDRISLRFRSIPLDWFGQRVP